MILGITAIILAKLKEMLGVNIISICCCLKIPYDGKTYISINSLQMSKINVADFCLGSCSHINGRIMTNISELLSTGDFKYMWKQLLVLGRFYCLHENLRYH